jgi:predicted transcriptional regulator of viral defense system
MSSENKTRRIAFLQDSPMNGEALRSASAVSVIQSRSRYFFQPEEFATLTAREPGSVSTKAALTRLSEKGQIVSVSKRPAGWLIVPPEFAHYGAPPVDWWLHDFVSLFEPHYYVALLSAAKHWGSSHYALQETQVMLAAPRRPLKAGKNKVVFFTKSEINKTPVAEVSAKVARLRVSTREATLLDLVRYQTKIGGIEAITRIASDFNAAMTGSGLFAALDALNNVSCAQRLGFIFDTLGLRVHTNVIESWLQGKHKSLLPLSTGEHTEHEKLTSHRWYVEYSNADLRHLKEQL